MAFLLEASFTLDSFLSPLFQPINISLTHFSPMQLLKRLSFSRLRADRDVHQEMPSGQLSVAHQSAALKIWMKGRRIIRAWYSRLKKKNLCSDDHQLYPFGNGFSYHPGTPGGDGHKGTDSSLPFQLHSKQLQIHESFFNDISQYKEMPRGCD